MRMPEHIETERLVLRKPRLDDARDMFEGWTQDQEVTRYLTWRPHAQIEQTEQFVQSCIDAWQVKRVFHM
jgi:ribosomal-protein-alanine N-acetyltransferase